MEALEKLYRLTEGTMYAYIISMAKNHEDTLDIMQDTYLKIRSAAHLYKPMGKPLSWMFTIAKNIARNKFRLEKRMKVAKLYEKITNIRKDYLHKISSLIVKEN